MVVNSDVVEEFCVIIKWSGKEYVIQNLLFIDNVKFLKEFIKDKIGVLFERQKFLGLKYKGIVW